MTPQKDIAMRPARLALVALAACDGAPPEAYPSLVPLRPILADADAPPRTDPGGTAALAARADALGARADALRRADPVPPAEADRLSAGVARRRGSD